MWTREDTRHGGRYNPQKRGRLSHHPLIAFVSDLRLVANMWLRSGDTSDANNLLSFLSDTFSNLEGKNVSLVRMDSGFCSDEIMSYLEAKNNTSYIIAGRFYQPIQAIAASKDMHWLAVDKGIEISEQRYQAGTWKAPRRLIIIRQKIAERPQAPGRQLRMFAEDDEVNGYRYGAYFTNLNLSAVEVWRLYRGRADAENRIKELKGDFGFDSFNMRSFNGTEASLTFAMLAYNLMAFFRQFILQGKTQQTLSTLRYRVFAIGAYFEKNKSGQTILRLALNLKRRAWFEGLWNTGTNTSPPYKKSIG
ncbi:MAG: transposase [Chitinophagaceae bacterium]